jgi:hypothetical protein
MKRMNLELKNLVLEKEIKTIELLEKECIRKMQEPLNVNKPLLMGCKLRDRLEAVDEFMDSGIKELE